MRSASISARFAEPQRSRLQIQQAGAACNESAPAAKRHSPVTGAQKIGGSPCSSGHKDWCRPIGGLHPVSETAKIRTAFDAACWHCLQDSNFWTEWCPEIRRPLLVAPATGPRAAPATGATSRREVEAIDALGGAAEEGALLVGRGAGGEAFQGVPQRAIADPHLLDGKVAFGQAAVGAEQVEAGQRIGTPIPGKLLGRGRRRQLEIVE